MGEYSYSSADTAGVVYLALCEKCKIITRHKVFVSARKRYDGEEWSSIAEYEVIQCVNCDGFSFRKEESNSEDYFYDQESGEYINDSKVDVYPSRIAGRFKLSGYTYLPLEVRAVYDEVMLAMNGEQPMLAGLGFRILIEIICKDKQAEGDSLFKKIDDLKSKGVLTKQGAEILHELRSMGNEAAHEAKPSTSKQLILAMDVVENLLQSVYIHPKQAVAAFKKD